MYVTYWRIYLKEMSNWKSESLSNHQLVHMSDGQFTFIDIKRQIKSDRIFFKITYLYFFMPHHGLSVYKTLGTFQLSLLSNSLSGVACGNQKRWKKHYCEQKEAKIQIFNVLLSNISCFKDKFSLPNTVTKRRWVFSDF